MSSVRRKDGCSLNIDLSVANQPLRPWSNMECRQPAAWYTETGISRGAPCEGLPRLTDQFRLDPIKYCALGFRCDRESSVYHVALEKCSGISRYATNPLFLSRMHAIYRLHPYRHTTHHIHGYINPCTNCD